MRIRRKTKKTLSIVLAIVLLVGAVFGIMALVDNNKDKLNTIYPSWAIGSLNAQGKWQEDEGAIYTKNDFDCNGLKITLDFDNQISYQVFYYDFDGEFISASDVSRVNGDQTVPMTAKSARIVLTPVEDDEVTLLEVPKYSNQIKIEVSEKQYEEMDDKYIEDHLVSIVDFDSATAVLGKAITDDGGFSDNDNFWNSGVYRVEEGKSLTFSPATPHKILWYSIADDGSFVVLSVTKPSVSTVTVPLGAQACVFQFAIVEGGTASSSNVITYENANTVKITVR